MEYGSYRGPSHFDTSSNIQYTFGRIFEIAIPEINSSGNVIFFDIDEPIRGTIGYRSSIS